MAPSKTIDYYDSNAASFVEETVGASMADALGAFVSMLPPGGHVLDWGCGSGRDSKVLRELGFSVTSTDGSAAMCAEALSATGTIVRHETFQELSEFDRYDGIWACVSLLHAHPDELPAILALAANALKAGGVLYCSFKYGSFVRRRIGRCPIARANSLGCLRTNSYAAAVQLRWLAGAALLIVAVIVHLN